MDRTFFITSVSHRRQALFVAHATATLLIEVLLYYRARSKYLLHDFVIMPDHFHALITPADNLSLERTVQFIKGGFSFRLHSSWPVWQPSFTNHRIRDAEDFTQHRRYIWMNPVRARLTQAAEAYPYSSANGCFHLDPAPGLKPLLEDRQTPT